MRLIRLVPSALLACALAAHAGPQDDAPADAPVAPVKLPVPWQPGMALAYATESVDVDAQAGVERRIVARDTTTITLHRAADGAWLQSWLSADQQLDLLAGEDDGTLAGMRAAAQAFEGVPLVVRLGPDAGYAGIEDLAGISARLREALRPVMVAGVEKALAGHPDAAAGTAKAPPAASGADARAEAMKRLDGVLASMTAPAVVEAMLRRTPENFNAFTGLELEAGATYQAKAELDNPLGETPFPAQLEFLVYEPEDLPGHLLLEWTSTIDPERGAQAAWEAAQTMLGIEFPPESRKGLPSQVSLADDGFILLDADGIPEMFENERAVVFGDRRSFDRQRMRLQNEHAHAWAHDDAGTWVPASTGDQPDGADALPATPATTGTEEAEQ